MYFTIVLAFVCDQSVVLLLVLLVVTHSLHLLTNLASITVSDWSLVSEY